MTYRHVAKVCIGLIVLMLGFVAFMQDVSAVGLACLGISIVIAILLFRKTPKDDEYMRRYRNGELLGQRLELGESWEPREKTPEGRVGCGPIEITLAGGSGNGPVAQQNTFTRCNGGDGYSRMR